MEFRNALICAVLTLPCVLASGHMGMHNMTDENTTMSMMDGMTHGMDHDGMDHSMPEGEGGMDHDGMDHDGMDHDGMDHGDDTTHSMDGGDHGGDHGGDGGDHGGDGEDHGGDGGHGTYFIFDNEVTIVFKEWVTTKETFIPSCVGVGLIAAFYEGFKTLRQYLIGKSVERRMNDLSCCTTFCACMHLLQTLLHVIQVAISYFLMLIFMSFNAWLSISVLIGAGFGYLVFGWTQATSSAVDKNEHCH